MRQSCGWLGVWASMKGSAGYWKEAQGLTGKNGTVRARRRGLGICHGVYCVLG